MTVWSDEFEEQGKRSSAVVWAIAATLAAGLAGIEERIEPVQQTTATQALPSDYLAALRRLATSTSAGRLLGEDFLCGYRLVKQAEYDSFLGELSAWERRYLVAQA